jgi:hypothetical protein
MRKELDEKLCEKYPEIFKDRYADMRTTAMCWGFECGDGWYNIIDAACAQIGNRAYNNRLNNVEFQPVVATQVKEKYGTLRFYYTGGDDYIDGVVSMAETISAKTCEVCGAPGKLREGGWLRTLCDEHAKEQGYEE